MRTMIGRDSSQTKHVVWPGVGAILHFPTVCNETHTWCNTCLTVYNALSQEHVGAQDVKDRHDTAHDLSSLPWPGFTKPTAHYTLAFEAAPAEHHDYTSRLVTPSHQYVYKPRMGPIISLMYGCSTGLADYAPLTQHQAPASARYQANSDTTSNLHKDADNSDGLEPVCTVHRRYGSDDMSFRCLVPGCSRSLSR